VVFVVQWFRPTERGQVARQAASSRRSDSTKLMRAVRTSRGLRTGCGWTTPRYVTPRAYAIAARYSGSTGRGVPPECYGSTITAGAEPLRDRHLLDVAVCSLSPSELAMPALAQHYVHVSALCDVLRRPSPLSMCVHCPRLASPACRTPRRPAAREVLRVLVADLSHVVVSGDSGPRHPGHPSRSPRAGRSPRAPRRGFFPRSRQPWNAYGELRRLVKKNAPPRGSDSPASPAISCAGRHRLLGRLDARTSGETVLVPDDRDSRHRRESDLLLSPCPVVAPRLHQLVRE